MFLAALVAVLCVGQGHASTVNQWEERGRVEQDRTLSVSRTLSVERSEACDNGWGTAYVGYLGCGTGQYQVGAQTRCPGSSDLWDSKCSTCATCPVGRRKGAGCSKFGVEACCKTGTHYVAGDTLSCSGINADCAAGGWCPGDGTRYTCSDAEKASTGLAAQTTEAGACTARSEDCCSRYGCSDRACEVFPGESYRGYSGCGAGQYETGQSQCCYGSSDLQCSACAECPAGKHKGTGCSRGPCCSADLWDGSACQWTPASCPADYWCPGDGTLHGPCSAVDKISTGLAGQATEAGACVVPYGRSESCCGIGNSCTRQRAKYGDRGCYGYSGCGAGQYETGRSSCPGCGPDWQCSACAACPAGQHKAAGCKTADRRHSSASFYDPSATSCDGTACLAGQFGPTGATTAAEASCTSCPAGWSTQGATGQTACAICAAGTHSESGASSCTDCPAGRFQSVTGQATCTACPVGWVTGATLGHTACTLCGADRQFQDAEGQAECKSCPAESDDRVPQWVNANRTACLSVCDCLRGGRDAGSGAFVLDRTCNDPGLVDMADGCRQYAAQCTD